MREEDSHTRRFPAGSLGILDSKIRGRRERMWFGTGWFYIFRIGSQNFGGAPGLRDATARAMWWVSIENF